jgi:hypothetical protein
MSYFSFNSELGCLGETLGRIEYFASLDLGDATVTEWHNPLLIGDGTHNACSLL